MILIQFLWIALRLLPHWWVGWVCLCWCISGLAPSWGMLQPYWAPRHNREYFVHGFFCSSSHSLCLKSCRLPEKCHGMQHCPGVFKLYACRGILGPRGFVTNVDDCSTMTLPTLEQISFTGCYAALAGLIIRSKVPGLKLDHISALLQPVLKLKCRKTVSTDKWKFSVIWTPQKNYLFRNLLIFLV